MSKYPLVSIVLPCFNASDLLEDCLSSLLTTKYPNYEIVIVDDHSTDNSFAKITAFFKKTKKVKTKILRNKVNMGASYTRNRCISSSRGEYIAFIETDMAFEPTWLIELVKHLQKHLDVAAVAGKSCDLIDRDVIGCVGIKFHPATFGVVGIGYKKNKNTYNTSREIGLGSVGTLFRKSVLEKVGGFDEKFGHNIDDIDLSWRMWVGGFRQESVPQSLSYHWMSKDMGQRTTRPLKSEMISYKVLRIFIKNYEYKTLLLYLPEFFMYQAIRISWNLVRLNFNPLIGFLYGLSWNVINLPDSLRARAKIQSFRRLRDKEIIKKIAYKGNYLQFVMSQLSIKLPYA